MNETGPSSVRRRAFKARGLIAIVVMSVFGVSVIRLWQSSIRDGQPGSRTEVINDLKVIGLAEANYTMANEGCFTPATVKNAEGLPVHGWFTLLLPYFDEVKRFDQIDFERSWDDPVNAELFRTPTRYRAELISRRELIKTVDGWPVIHVSMNSRLYADDHLLTIDDVARADGTSNTLLFGQISDGFPPWGKPGNARDFALGLRADARTFGWKGNYQTVVGFCDGSATTINNDIDPKVLKSLAIWNDERPLRIE
jgi:hypothetical protein